MEKQVVHASKRERHLKRCPQDPSYRNSAVASVSVAVDWQHQFSAASIIEEPR